MLCLAARGSDGALVEERTEVDRPSGSYDWGALAGAVRGEPLAAPTSIEVIAALTKELYAP